MVDRDVGGRLPRSAKKRVKRWLCWMNQDEAEKVPRCGVNDDLSIQAEVQPMIRPPINRDCYRWIESDDSFVGISEPSCWIQSKISEKHLEEGILRNVFEPASPWLQGMTRVTEVREPRRGRVRLVADTLAANIAMGRLPKVRFRPIEAVIDTFRKCEAVASIDLKTFFHQFSLDESIRRRFTFLVRGKFFRYKVLPMGFSGAVEIAQETALWLAAQASIGEKVLSDVYIDNIAFAGARDAVERVMVKLKLICAQHSVTIGEVQANYNYVTHRGVEIYANGTFRLKPSLVEKIYEKKHSSLLRWSEWHTDIARLIYALRVLRHPKNEYFDLFKWYGKERKAFQWVEPPPLALKQWRDACALVQRNCPQICDEPLPVVTLFTDASKYGAAGIFIEESKAYEIAAVWSEVEREEFIAILEMRAIGQALKNLENARVVLYTDNTVCMHVLRKMFSPSLPLNKELSTVIGIMRSKNLWLSSVEYIPSEMNPADSGSRGELSSWEKKTLTFLHMLGLGR